MTDEPTNEECIEQLEEHLASIQDRIQRLESDTLQVISSGMDMKWAEIQKSKLQYAIAKGALVAMIDYTMLRASIPEYPGDESEEQS